MISKLKSFGLAFWRIFTFSWENSKATLLLKPALYLLAIIIAAYKNDIKLLIFLGFICVILDILLNTFESKKFEEKVNKTENEKIDLQKKVDCLEDEVEVQGQLLENHLNAFLVFLFNQLRFKRTERISVYVRDDKKFRIVGRYSSHPDYSEKGRESYEGDKGFISKCWRGDSEDFIKILPSYEDDRDRYYEEQSKVGYLSEEIDKLSMKPSLFYVLNISKTNAPSIGVLVIESKNSGLDRYASYDVGDEEEGMRKRLSKELEKYCQYLYDIMDTKRIQK